MPSTLVNDYRISFRIQPNDRLERELDRLAHILSEKYNTELSIVVRERRKRP